MKNKYNTWVIGWIVLMHIGALAAPFTFTWRAFSLFAFMSWLTGGIGICLCYHRLLTHRSFKVPKWLEYTLTLFAVLSTEGGPINWVARHRMHHAYSDTDRDPHSPRQGFWWAHMFWLFKYKPALDDYEQYSPYAKDLIRDPFHRFISRTHGLYPILFMVFLYFWGGLPFLVWGGFFRTVFVYHITWFVNSATHVWGYQSYKSGDDSRNLWWVAFLSFGEGWHNNHHAFQRSARHGLRFWEIDVTYMAISVLKFFNLAKRVHVPEIPTTPVTLPQFPHLVDAIREIPAQAYKLAEKIPHPRFPEVRLPEMKLPEMKLPEGIGLPHFPQLAEAIRDLQEQASKIAGRLPDVKLLESIRDLQEQASKIAGRLPEVKFPDVKLLETIRDLQKRASKIAAKLSEVPKVKVPGFGLSDFN